MLSAVQVASSASDVYSHLQTLSRLCLDAPYTSRASRNLRSGPLKRSQPYI